MKHQATKSPSDQLMATEWNAEHLLTEGLDADKPSSGLTARQLYWATDTKILYKAISATEWEELLRDDHASRHVDGGADEITSKLDFRAINIMQAKATATTPFSTTSTSFVDVTGLSVNINLPQTSVVFVSCSTYAIRNLGGVTFGTCQRLVRDSTVIRYSMVTGGDNDSWNGLITTLDVNVAAGSHTYKLRGRVASDGTSFWDMSAIDGYQGEIFVIAFKY